MSDRGAVIWMSLGFLLLSAGAVWVHSASLDEDFRLAYWQLSPQDVQDLEALEAGRLLSRQDSDAARELERKFRDYHETLLTLRPDDQKGQRAAEGHLHDALKTFLDTSNSALFLAEGTRLAGEFRRQLLLLEEEIEATRLAPSQWLSSAPGSPALAEVRRLSGTFLEHALSSGLFTVDPETRRDRMWVASTLWLERWLGMVGPEMPDASISPLERRLVSAWKVEAAEHLSVERKLQILGEIRQVAPSYPALFVAGALLTRAGRAGEAQEVFQRCIQTGEERERAAAWLKHLRNTQEP